MRPGGPASLVCVAVVILAAGVVHADHRRLWLHDVYRGDDLRIAPFSDHGHVRAVDWVKLTRFFRSRPGARHPVHPGLLRVLAHVQSHFDGRRLELLSGYRQPDDPQALSSYHQVGHAADLWIVGVPNRVLFDYCRQLQAQGELLGCGLYPAGSHVHIDVRSQATIWVDLSGYGDGALYVPDPARWLDENSHAGR